MASGRGGVDLQFQWSIQNQSMRACPGTKTWHSGGSKQCEWILGESVFPARTANREALTWGFGCHVEDSWGACETERWAGGSSRRWGQISLWGHRSNIWEV